MISATGSQPHLMGRVTRIALAALLVSVAVAPHAFAQQELTFSLFERYIDALRVQANIPGMSAVIVQDERVTWQAAFWFADLDDPIQQPVPAYSESNTTMRDLLSHKSPTSGFKYDAGRYATGLTPLAEDCVGGGTPFRQALWERIFQRLAMFDSVPAQNVDDSTADDRVQFDSTELERFTGVLRRLALPYRVSGSSATVNTSLNKSVDAATGAISTVLDLAKFDSAIDGAVLLHRESMATMWTNQSGMPTGLGWFVQNYNGQKVVWQFGNTPGAYSSLILKVPDRHLTLILLANSDGLSAPFPLQDGDVTSSLFARTFLRLFVG